MDVIITGASRGLGNSIAALFAEQGHDLYLTSLHEKKLYDAVEDLVKRFPRVTVKAKPFDLSKKEGAKAFGKWCLQHCSPDILINNAGSFAGSNVHDEEEGALEEIF